MTCTSCAEAITVARLAAVPTATLCVACASADDVPRTVGFMVWEHKTAPSIEIGTVTAKAQAGRKHSYGPHFQLDSKEGCAGPMQEAQGMRDLSERLRREGRHEVDPDALVAPVLRNPSRCHPDAERIGPSGLCLPCALRQQTARLR